MYPADDLQVRIALAREASRDMVARARDTLNESRALAERMRAQRAVAGRAAAPAFPSRGARPHRPPP